MMFKKANTFFSQGLQGKLYTVINQYERSDTDKHTFYLRGNKGTRKKTKKNKDEINRENTEWNQNNKL